MDTDAIQRALTTLESQYRDCMAKQGQPVTDGPDRTTDVPWMPGQEWEGRYTHGEVTVTPDGWYWTPGPHGGGGKLTVKQADAGAAPAPTKTTYTPPPSGPRSQVMESGTTAVKRAGLTGLGEGMTMPAWVWAGGAALLLLYVASKRS